MQRNPPDVFLVVFTENTHIRRNTLIAIPTYAG